MTHPLDRLAPFADGSLDPAERALVDEHLRSCARCRDEVAAARGARDAVRAMPVPAGPDLASVFTPARISELTTAHPQRPAWAKVAPAIAAAAVVALVALALPRLGGSSGDAGTTAADAAAESGAGAAALRLEIADTDYDELALRAAAGAFVASRAVEGADVGDRATAGAASPAAAGATRFAGPGRTERAIACLHRAFRGFPGDIVRVQQAAFRGTPAYVGFVLEGPGAGTPPDTMSIWVAAVDDCSILTLTSARL